MIPPLNSILTILQYDSIKEALKSTTSIDKRDICLGALGLAGQPDLISRTIAYAMSPEIIAMNETERVLESLAKHAAGKEALWEWFKSNMEEIYGRLGGGLGRFAMFVQLCTRLCTRGQWEDMKGFFEGKDTEVSFVIDWER